MLSSSGDGDGLPGSAGGRGFAYSRGLPAAFKTAMSKQREKSHRPAVRPSVHRWVLKCAQEPRPSPPKGERQLSNHAHCHHCGQVLYRVEIIVRSKAPDGTLTLDLDDGTIALGPALAAQLYVATVTPAA